MSLSHLTPSPFAYSSPYLSKTLLYFLVLFLSLSFSLMNECRYDPLPQGLDSAQYLGYNREIHLFSTYRFDFSKPSSEIHFDLVEPSQVRMAVTPHEVELELSIINGKNVLASSRGQIDTQVFAKLPVGISFKFVITHNAHADQMDDCGTVTIEIAIVPLLRLQERITNQLHKDACEGRGRGNREEFSNGKEMSTRRGRE